MTVAGLCIEKGKIMDVQKHISADHWVFAVYDVTGDWDSMVLARVENREDLDDLIKKPCSLSKNLTLLHPCSSEYGKRIRRRSPRGMMANLLRTLCQVSSPLRCSSQLSSQGFMSRLVIESINLFCSLPSVLSQSINTIHEPYSSTM